MNITNSYDRNRNSMLQVVFDIMKTLIMQLICLFIIPQIYGWKRIFFLSFFFSLFPLLFSSFRFHHDSFAFGFLMILSFRRMSVTHSAHFEKISVCENNTDTRAFPVKNIPRQDGSLNKIILFLQYPYILEFWKICYFHCSSIPLYVF